MANRLSRESLEVIGITITKGNVLSRESVEVIGYIVTATGQTFRVILV